jgi:hypothetical protein
MPDKRVVDIMPWLIARTLFLKVGLTIEDEIGLNEAEALRDIFCPLHSLTLFAVSYDARQLLLIKFLKFL